MKTINLLATAAMAIMPLFLFSCDKSNAPAPNTPEESEPIVIEGRLEKELVLTNHRNGVDYIFKNVEIKAAGHITVKEGVEVEVYRDLISYAGMDIAEGCTFTMDGQSLWNFEYGSLVATGTQAKPIVFKGKTRSAGFWKGIKGGSITLKYCNISDGGLVNDSWGSNNPDHNAMVFVFDNLNVTNCHLDNSAKHGILYIGRTNVTGNPETANTFSNIAGQNVYVWD